MFPETVINSEFVRAYRGIDFVVESNQPFTLKINKSNESLVLLFKKHQCNSALYITAINPYSVATSHEENIRIQLLPENELNSRSLTYFPGVGTDSKGRWSGESSFLVLGLSLEASKVLGQAYKQNALVWCGSDAVPKLILLRCHL